MSGRSTHPDESRYFKEKRWTSRSSASQTSSINTRRFFSRRTRSILISVVLALLVLSLLRRLFSSSSSSRRPSSKVRSTPPPWSPYAYSLYATSPNYLCNAVMIIETLSRLGAEADLLLLYNDKWLLTPNTFEGRLLIRAMDDYGAALKPVSVVRHGKVWTWQDSFTKLLAFEQGQYQRVLSLDSDATVLQTMDELFTTPMVSVAAPNAYWLDQGALSSQVILIQPSKDEYQRIVRDESHLKDDDFDMEVLNHLYKGNATRLPHRPYNLITGEFRRPTHFGYLDSKDEVWNASTVLEEAKYVHFSDWPLPKPWMKGSDTQVKGLLANCTTNAELDCDSLTVWEGIYQDYWARRGRVCDDLLQGTKVLP